jgi:hypothetical protein
MVAGFLERDLSLTLTFLPFFYSVLAVTAFRGLVLQGQRIRLSRSASIFVWLSVLMIALALTSGLLNVSLLRLPVSVALFSVAIPVTILMLQLVIWLTPSGAGELRGLLRVLWVVWVIDAFVSMVTFVGVNVAHLLPAQVFWLNQRYVSILFPVAGQLWVRATGIFESGGSNGSFLLILLSLSASYVTFRAPRRFRLGLWALLAVQTALVFSTLTRRSILGMWTVVMVILVLGALQGRRTWVPVGGIVAVSVGSLVLLPSLSSARTLVMRIGFWRAGLERLVYEEPHGLFVGLGVTQSASRFLDQADFALIDNTYLALVTFGGVVFLVLFLAYYVLLLIANLRLLRRIPTEDHWLAAANVAMIANLFVVSIFAVFATNLTEAFPYMLFVNLSTTYVWQRAEAAGPGRAKKEH